MRPIAVVRIGSREPMRMFIVIQWSLSCMATTTGPVSLHTATVTVWLIRSRSAGSALQTSATGLMRRNPASPIATASGPI